jgi:hypothetical protein
MGIPTRRIITWYLTAFFAALVGVHDGWHFVPGNGHWVETPGGHGVYVGIREADRRSEIPCKEGAFDQEYPEPEPLKSEADCAICRFSGQQKQLRLSFDCVLSSPAQQSAPCLVRRVLCIRVPQSLHSRAPPWA